MAFSSWIIWLDRKTRRRQGSILVFVLVLLAIIATLLVQSQLEVRGRLSRAAAGLDQARMQAALTDGILHALQVLADDDNLQMDHTSEPWSAPVEYKDPTGISVTIRLEDLNRYFDLNNLSVEVPNLSVRPVEEIMHDLLALCGDMRPSDRLQSLRDWVDSDREGFRESPYYEEKTPPYQVADRWLSSWDELNWVNGFSRSYFGEDAEMSYDKDYHRALLETFTLIPVSREEFLKVNINTAPRHVLVGILGLSMTPFIDNVIQYRKDYPLPSMDKLNAQLDEPMASNFNTYFDVKSAFYRVAAQAYLGGHSSAAQAWVYRQPDGAVEVIRWVK